MWNWNLNVFKCKLTNTFSWVKVHFLFEDSKYCTHPLYHCTFNFIETLRFVLLCCCWWCGCVVYWHLMLYLITGMVGSLSGLTQIWVVNVGDDCQVRLKWMSAAKLWWTLFHSSNLSISHHSPKFFLSLQFYLLLII